MKKLLLILSALLLITGCKVEESSCSHPVESEDKTPVEYRDGIYVFFIYRGNINAANDPYQHLKTKEVDIYVNYVTKKNLNAKKIINLNSSNISDVIEIYPDDLKKIYIRYADNEGNYRFGIHELDSSNFNNITNGLYCVDIYYNERATYFSDLIKVYNYSDYSENGNYIDNVNFVYIKKNTDYKLNIKYGSSFVLDKACSHIFIIRDLNRYTFGEIWEKICITSNEPSCECSLDLSEFNYKGKYYIEINDVPFSLNPIEIKSISDIPID